MCWRPSAKHGGQLPEVAPLKEFGTDEWEAEERSRLIRDGLDEA